jgi:predicted hydrocarbon binding protein
MKSSTLVFRKACGCVTLLVVNRPEVLKDCGKDIGRALAKGDRMEEMATEEVRKMPIRCEEHRKPREVAPGMRQGVLLP